MSRLVFISLALVVALCGCASESGPPRGPVKGRVTMGGKPVASATIVFENAELGVAQTAPLDGEGNYEFSAHNAKGLPAGSYKVALAQGRFMQPGEEIPFVDVTKPPPPAPAGTSIPEKYTKAQTSGLTADVKADSNPPFNFDLVP